MARTLQEIKGAITTDWLNNEAVKQRYQIDDSKTFDEQFSPVSIENIFFYIVAVAIWTLEVLFDLHKSEVETELQNKMPTTVHWYKNKVLRFQYPNRNLIPDTDKYDNTGLTPEQIADLEIVKYCAVTDALSELRIKVAKGEAGNRIQLAPDEETALNYYLSEICPAGIRWVIINRQADKFKGEITVYYNPLLLNPDLNPVENAVKEYISNLDFNGALTTTHLTDQIQNIEGVVLVDINSALVQRADNPEEALGVQKIAESGYWIVENNEDLKVNYIVYDANKDEE